MSHKALSVLKVGAFILVAMLFMAVVHAVVYTAIVTMFLITSRAVLWALRIGAVILAVSFLIASWTIQRHNTRATRWAYVVSAVWLGLLFYIFAASVIYGLAIGAVAMFAPHLVIWGFQLQGFGVGLFILADGLTIYGLIHARHIIITEKTIALPGLPDAWQGRTAVFVSDIHLGQVRSKAFAKRIVSIIESVRPDIVFIGGDLYDGVKVDETDVVAPFAGLKPPHGVYFIMGNHEEFRDNSKFRAAIEGVGIRVLVNELVNIEGVDLIGVDDRDATDKAKFLAVMERLQASRQQASRLPDSSAMAPSILLKHQPALLDIAEKHGISFQISGHTHKAQIFPLSLITKSIYRGYDYGLHSFGAMQVYTSSGVGTWGPPMRIGTNAEIVKLTFERGGEDDRESAKMN